MHKYYTHQKIDFPSSKYAICLLEKENNLFEYIQEIDIPFPWIIKPCTGACSSSIFKVNNTQ
ncbi:MAG: hypothetical protein F6K40_14550 [Okeania sp. SIO3I5]|uniref:hypothetical protein n=1 Tax=Okeania sp. SIO3I5 TaxID=2607805 RepID=UPI0013BB9873|nr:hypothetical protein [Okeania sp. SIO3I5]NEQ37418.1 hypothetical protein [Okeania sp. SIO3I5]